MTDSSHKKYSKTIKIIFILAVFVFFFCPNLPAAEEVSEMQKEARDYRAKGLEYQNAGDLATATIFYQRAIILDPFYAMAYNDLGIIYEANGAIEEAKELYLRAVEIDPNLLGAYANLALIFEQQRDLEKAAYYWEKRVALGSPDDSWTIKAKRRLADIRLVLSDNPAKETREQETIKLCEEVGVKKSFLAQGDRKKGDKMLAQEYLEKAKRLYKQGKELPALKVAVDAGQLDPSNTEIEEFLDKVSTRILSR